MNEDSDFIFFRDDRPDFVAPEPNEDWRTQAPVGDPIPPAPHPEPRSRTWVAIVLTLVAAVAVFWTSPLLRPVVQQVFDESRTPTPTAPAPTTPAAPGSGAPSADAPAPTHPSATPSSTASPTANPRRTTPIDTSVGVVLINVTTTNGGGAGSGMALEPNGLVLTNYHVVQTSETVQVTIANTGQQFTATVLGFDSSRDVALLQLQGASNLDTVTIDDDTLAVGDTVRAVGNSRGQGYLRTSHGVVTDLSAVVNTANDNSLRGFEQLTDVIETSVPAVSGDSGGPLFDSEGEVVGMTTAGKSTNGEAAPGQAISYAVPIERALSIAKQIVEGDDSGSVTIGPKSWLGIIVPVQSGRAGVTPQGLPGVTLSSSAPGGPAEKAGLGPGSTITALGGVRVENSGDLADELAKLSPGDTTTIAWVDAAGIERSGDITVAASPVN